VAKIGSEIISEEEYRAAMLTQFRSEDNIKQRTLDERKKVARDLALEEAKYLEGLRASTTRTPKSPRMSNPPRVAAPSTCCMKRRLLSSVMTDAIAERILRQVRQGSQRAPYSVEEEAPPTRPPQTNVTPKNAD
jgi:hypothetical protein